MDKGVIAASVVGVIIFVYSWYGNFQWYYFFTGFIFQGYGVCLKMAEDMASTTDTSDWCNEIGLWVFGIIAITILGIALYVVYLIKTNRQ